MKHFIAISILVFLCFSFKSDDAPVALEGTWIVDVTPSPHSEKETQEMILNLPSRVMLQGTMGGLEITNAKINHHWPNLHIGFKTQDGEFEYYHTAYLQNDTLYGTTFCPRLNELQPWSAVKKKDN